METAGAFNTTVSEVIRPTKFGGYTPKNWQIVITSDTDINEELSHPGNPPATCFVTTFAIRCHVIPSERSETPIDTLTSQFAADVRKAICTSTTWYTMGGYAVIADFGKPEQIASETSIGGIVVPLVVTFRTDEDDPYTVRA